MLRDLLVQFDGVATWPCDEINYLWRHFNARWPDDALPPELATPPVQRYVRNAFYRQARRTSAGFIVEKTCANSLRVDFVERILPEARFVFLVRDGRDVVPSAVRRWHARLEPRYLARKARFVPLGDLPHYAARYARNRLARLTSRQRRMASWGPQLPGMPHMLATATLEHVCGEQWRQCVTRAAASLAAIPSSRVTIVRYESFVRQPPVELARLLNFLHIPYEPVHLERVGRSVSADRIGSGRQSLDSAFLEAFEPIVQATLSVVSVFESGVSSSGQRAA
jgi:hypothetical protein